MHLDVQQTGLNQPNHSFHFHSGGGSHKQALSYLPRINP
jgi:hypothetical protein